MNRFHTPPRRTAWVCCCLSLALATGAFAGSSNRFAASDISQPDFFPILPWSPYYGWSKPLVERRQNGLESIAECGFNMAGFVLPKDLSRCKKLGLGAIMLPAEDAYTSMEYLRAWRTLSDAEIERRVKAMVRAAGSSPAV